ncbi:MAG TPA: hypothetical protein VJW77_02330 [Terriglobia bacterium]|nr:hypothetical protein [Terriglobia bacterium]
MPEPQSYDLTDVATLIEYANLLSPNQQVQDIAQEVISGFSRSFYRYAGRTAGIYSAVTNLTEWYDGNNADILYTINDPIVSVSSVAVNGTAVPQSTGVTAPGWFIDQSQKAIVMRWNSGGYGQATFANTDWAVFSGLQPYLFLRGRGNVEIVYSAGTAAVPDDLLLAALKQCTVFLNRRLREDERSKTIPSAGTTSYASWAWSPDVLQICAGFKRQAAYTY